jgi:N-acetylglucosaminyldiphosphoundecaprenol N-acetyl-beta-D-mannosaminyltransferase
MRVVRPFGLTLSMDSAQEIVSAALSQPPADGVSLVVTPNIDHIATIRRSPALARAYRKAARIVCDGWPVQLYARFCGLPVARVTGCEITSDLMRMAPYPTPQRFFFVVDNKASGGRLGGPQRGRQCRDGAAVRVRRRSAIL